jgi:hypothetical protein
MLMGDFTFKLLLYLPGLLLLWESFVNIYYWYFNFSFVLQVSLLLLWGVTVRWVLKTRQMPAPVVASAFVVMYLSLVVDGINPTLRTYLDNALWAGAYAYLLRAYHLKSGREQVQGRDKLSSHR